MNFGGLKLMIVKKSARANRARKGAQSLASAAVLALMAPIAAHAQEAAPQQQNGRAVRIDIPAQPLDSALTALADQAGLKILFSSGDVAGLRGNDLNGTFAPADALSRLLAGSGFTFRFVGKNAVTLEFAPEAADGTMQLGSVRVEGASDRRNSGLALGDSEALTTEGTGSYTARAVGIGGKVPHRLREIPQAVTVVTQERIEEQNLREVSDAMAQATGIVTQGLSQGSIAYSRGFPIETLRIDGGTQLNVGSSYFNLGNRMAPDLAQFDHVEVLRGNDALFSGSGEPGGAINLVRKRPLRDAQLKFTASVGSWHNYRVEVDVAGPLTDGGALRGRLVTMYQDRKFFFDNAERDKTLMFGTIEADVSSSTLLTSGVVFERNHDPVENWIPRYADGRELGLPRSRSTSPAWPYIHNKSVEAFGKLDQKFGEDWLLRANLSYLHATSNEQFPSVLGALDPFSLTGVFMRGTEQHWKSRQISGDLSVNGGFEALGGRHEVTLGATFQDIDADYDNYVMITFPFPQIDPLVPNTYPQPSVGYRDYFYPVWTQRQSAIYGQAKLALTPALKLTLGGRVARYSFDVLEAYPDANGAYSETYPMKFKDSGVFTGYAGLGFDIAKDWSFYASWSQSYRSQADKLDNSRQPLSPITGTNYEIGIKGELLDGRVNTSLAFYWIDRRNEGIPDPNNEPYYGNPCCYLQVGKVVSKGIDAEISGEILPGWNLFAGYTFNDNKSETPGQPELRYSSLTPRHLFKLWTSYRPSGALSGLELGGGLIAQSKTWAAGTVTVYDSMGNATGSAPLDFTQKGYALVNLRVTYDLNDKWNIALNIDNVFDTTYWKVIQSRGSQYGEPRNFMLTLRARY